VNSQAADNRGFDHEFASANSQAARRAAAILPLPTKGEAHPPLEGTSLFAERSLRTPEPRTGVHRVNSQGAGDRETRSGIHPPFPVRVEPTSQRDLELLA